jgi:hypothetical protein
MPIQAESLIDVTTRKIGNDIYFDYSRFIGEKVNSISISTLKSAYYNHLQNIKEKGLRELKIKADGGIYTITNPEDVGIDLANECGAYSIKMSLGINSKILSFEKDIEEIKRAVKQRIRNNLLIKVNSKRHHNLNPTPTTQEEKARNTLRDIISEKEWRRYLTNSFIIISGKKDFMLINPSNKKDRGISGPFVYQVFEKQSHIRVYANGKRVKDICIHTDAGCPPTDHILNMMVMINHDEQMVWDLGNIHEVHKESFRTIPYEETRVSLFEYFQSVKQPMKQLYVA